MSIPPLRHSPPAWPAPCGPARRWLVFCAAISLLFLLMTGMLLVSRRAHPPQAPTITWMQAFTRSRPALWPAGSPDRHPETLHPGIDLRIAPGLEGTP
ncbi:hypothetical protein DESC_770037 [Desulfosarcina cetonica]|nr:hypothetical protein DESC_770037 [Desulfosarcina cetonica]